MSTTVSSRTTWSTRTRRRRSRTSGAGSRTPTRSEEHTSELQSLRHLVCRLLLEKKKNKNVTTSTNEATCGELDWDIVKTDSADKQGNAVLHKPVTDSAKSCRGSYRYPDNVTTQR